MKTLALEVLRFWFGEGADYGKAHKRWFEKDRAFDAEVSERFGSLHEEMLAGERRDWLDEPRSCLARIIVLDQFPRHIHRGTARAFASDPLALEAAKHLVSKGWNPDLLPVERMFAYLPFEHSESPRTRNARACSARRCSPSPRWPTLTAMPSPTATSFAASGASRIAMPR